MKIIQISASYKPAYIYGGPIMSVAKLCEALVETQEQRAKNKEQRIEIQEQGTKSKEWDLKVEVFTTTANGKSELTIDSKTPLLVDGVRVRYFKRLTKDHTHFSPALLWNLRKEILLNKEQRTKSKEQRAKIDNITSTNNEQTATNNELIIHIHAWWNLVSVLSCLVAKWYKIPVLLSPRGMLTNYTLGNRNSFSKSLIHYLIGKRLLRYCHFHATSEKEKLDILSVISPRSITVIPNLVELGKVQSPKSEIRSRNEKTTNNEQRTTNNEPIKLIFLSRIEEKKGLELLFEALAMLKFNWSLTIAGMGTETYVNSLKQKTESLKLDEKIDWVGQIDKKDKFNLLASHHLLLLTSHNENFANVVIESLSVGTAVLVSKEVGLYDYVEAKNLGWITDLNIDKIKQQLLDAFDNSVKRKQIRLTAPEIIRKDFKVENLVARYLNLYDKISGATI